MKTLIIAFVALGATLFPWTDQDTMRAIGGNGRFLYSEIVTLQPSSNYFYLIRCSSLNPMFFDCQMNVLGSVANGTTVLRCDLYEGFKYATNADGTLLTNSVASNSNGQLYFWTNSSTYNLGSTRLNQWIYTWSAATNFGQTTQGTNIYNETFIVDPFSLGLSSTIFTTTFQLGAGRNYMFAISNTTTTVTNKVSVKMMYTKSAF